MSREGICWAEVVSVHVVSRTTNPFGPGSGSVTLRTLFATGKLNDWVSQVVAGKGENFMNINWDIAPMPRSLKGTLRHPLSGVKFVPGKRICLLLICYQSFGTGNILNGACLVLKAVGKKYTRVGVTTVPFYGAVPVMCFEVAEVEIV